ncbi:electron transport complex subunit A [Alkalispirochaeta sphaeroplastigenens]|uniref:Ion-translocating oxidoreductase complex subunit A n=1 Tax=Alkalispirochaeta sphaeroplastigenens TaxID=1187066 RepID=A0A2S4JNE2_9SPIO|nr:MULTISPECIES: electron transport complex protein RnfA [Alkalispirochaeta]POR00993.1 electron transport complex subunit A [Alkalispirochaeta sphaeroplastigenens]
MDYMVIIIGAVLVNNIVLSQFLGICPFLGVSSRVSTAVGMGAAVIFVMTMATIATFLIQTMILEPLGLVFLQTVSFILVIASLVQLVEIVLKKVSPALYQALGVFLPLITTNCAILGVAIIVVGQGYTLGQGVVYAIGSSLGFVLALYVFAGLREKMDLLDIPKAMRGAPISLVTAGLLALAFGGFAGLV